MWEGDLLSSKLIKGVKDLPHRHMTNSGNWILTVGIYLHNGCKDRDYFLHFKKIGTNLQNGYKDGDQNAYSLY